jgi:hypothetical protein
MPGLSTYDFGDAIRFAANTAVEDETDLSKAELDMNKYEEFTKGFMTASKEFLIRRTRYHSTRSYNYNHRISITLAGRSHKR